MELRFGIFCLVFSMCYSISAIAGYKQLTLPLEMIEQWSTKFGEKIVTLTKNFTAYDYLFNKFSKNGARRDVDGSVLVHDIANKIEKLLADKVEAVKRLVAKAEETYENYTFDEHLDYDYLNNKKLLSDREAEEIHNSGNPNVAEMEIKFQSIRLEPSSKFNYQPINNETSTVQVATNVFDGSATIMNGAYWSHKLDETFKQNQIADPSLTWQYFCSSDGFFRIFPGMKWPRDNDETGIDMFDCRIRSWYLQAATCRKSIIILIDTSGSMKGLRMQIARSTVHQILDTLTDDDYFNIIRISADVEYVDSCFNFTMVPANTYNKARLREFIDMEIETKDKADFERAFVEAFNLLNYSEFLRKRKGTKLCNKAILLVTDGVPENYEWIFKKYNWPDKKTRVFTYLIGREVSDEREVKWMACANKGYYSHISSLSDVREHVQNYIKVLSRPLVIEGHHISEWTSVYLDHFSSLDIKEGLKFMTSVAVPVFDTKNETYYDGNLLGVVGTDVPIKSMIELAPPHKLGPNAFVFLVNRNGYVLAHPHFKPYKKMIDSEEIIMNPNYNNIDLLDVMLSTNKAQLEWRKENMLTNYRGDVDLELLMNYDKQRRMAKRKYGIFYRKIMNTSFTIGIALPSTSLVDIKLANVAYYDLKNCLNSSGFELAPWKYCNDIDENMTSREKIFRILAHSKDSKILTNKMCDTNLLDQLAHDNLMTLEIEEKWLKMANKFPSSYGVELIFVGTKGGLTKYLKVQNVTNDQYISRRADTINADYYRRAVEGVERLDNQPEYNVTFSLPLRKEIDVNTTMVTASIPIVIRNGPNKMGVRAVAGIQLKYENFAQLFFESFGTCDSYPCKNSLTCKNDSVSCYLVDNHGYVMASKTPETDIGKFFGEVDAQVMTYLVMFNNTFVRENFTDHQAICDVKASDRKQSSGSSILNPLKILFNGIMWTITEIALFVTEFSWSRLWSNVYNSVSRVTAQMDEEGMINCEVAELQDYEDDDLRSVERFALAQLTQYCQMHWLHRDEVVGHRSCDKSFTLYRSNFNALKEPVQGLIQNCQTCLSWSSCDPEDLECVVECIEYDKYIIKHSIFDSARMCEKPYVATWVKDTNLIFVMTSRNCDCMDEMPFNLQRKEVNYTKEETCSKLKQATFRDNISHCYDFTKVENDTRCGVPGVSLSTLLWLPPVMVSVYRLLDRHFNIAL